MKREKIKNVYMFDTKVENIFINEHLASATGEQIKVFLMGLMYAEIGMDISDEDLARSLGLELSVVLEAWNYWIKKNAVRRNEDGIEFLNLKERVYGDNPDETAGDSREIQSNRSSKSENEYSDYTKGEAHPLINKEILELFTKVESIIGRPLNHKERELITDFSQYMNASHEIIAYGFKYAYDREKKNIRYISKIIQEWVHRGYKTEEDVEEELSKYDRKFHVYKRVLRALGFSRMPSEEERKIMDNWMELGVSVETMVQACSKTAGISNPNIKYVDKIILGDLSDKKDKKSSNGSEKIISRKQVLEYVEKLREKEEELAKQRVEEVESKIPEIKVLRDKNRKNIMEMAMVSGNSEERNKKINIIKKENEKIRESINALLHRNDIPVDYMEIHYKCGICRDNLVLDDGSQCSCFMDRERELVEKVQQEKSEN